jgi:hypothetical protein
MAKKSDLATRIYVYSSYSGNVIALQGKFNRVQLGYRHNQSALLPFRSVVRTPNAFDGD